jgi:hypothetical protein
MKQDVHSFEFGFMCFVGEIVGAGRPGKENNYKK